MREGSVSATAMAARSPAPAGPDDRDVDFDHVHEAPSPKRTGRSGSPLCGVSMRHGAPEQALIQVNVPFDLHRKQAGYGAPAASHAAIWVRSSPVISVTFPRGIALDHAALRPISRALRWM